MGAKLGILPQFAHKRIAAQPRHVCRIGEDAAASRHLPVPNTAIFCAATGRPRLKIKAGATTR
jgi:hypothetical protein